MILLTTLCIVGDSDLASICVDSTPSCAGDCVNAKIVHFYTKCFDFVMHPWDSNIETYCHKSSFMGDLQNLW